MSQLVIDDAQASLLSGARGPVEILDQKGNLVGYASPVWTDEDVRDARKRLASDAPRYTTEEVLLRFSKPPVEVLFAVSAERHVVEIACIKPHRHSSE